MADFYLDEGVTVSLAPELRARGHTARTVRDLGLLGALDSRHLLLAAQREWIFLTHDRRDFFLLHDAWVHWTTTWQVPERHAGILLLAQGVPAWMMAQEINQFLPQARLFANQFYEWSPRGGWIHH